MNEMYSDIVSESELELKLKQWQNLIEDGEVIDATEKMASYRKLNPQVAADPTLRTIWFDFVRDIWHPAIQLK